MAKPFKGGSGGRMPPQGISGGVWGGNAPPGKPGTLKKGDGENWRGGDPVSTPGGNFSGSRWGG